MSKFDMDVHKNIWGSDILKCNCFHEAASTAEAAHCLPGAGPGEVAGAFMQCCPAAVKHLGCFNPTASSECSPSQGCFWGFRGISTLAPCTGALGRYQNILLPTWRLVQVSSTKSLSDKNLLAVVSLSKLLLARIRGDWCSALTLEQLPGVLWIQCQIRREASSARHGTHAQMSKVQHLTAHGWSEGKALTSLLCSRITSHCKFPLEVSWRQSLYNLFGFF